MLCQSLVKHLHSALAAQAITRHQNASRQAGTAGERNCEKGTHKGIWRTVMLGLRPRLSVVRLVNTAMSVAGKGHCRLKPLRSKRRRVPLAVQIWPGKLHQLVNRRFSLLLRVFQSEQMAAEPLQQLRVQDDSVHTFLCLASALQ